MQAGTYGRDGVYYNLKGVCRNISQRQFVSVTAVSEQWRTFFYEICFFKSVSQHEINEEERGRPRKTILGRTSQFLDPAAVPSAEHFGFDQLFFAVGKHTQIYIEGDPCPGQRMR